MGAKILAWQGKLFSRTGGSLLLWAICSWTLASGQTGPPASESPTFRAESRLVLVDVVPEYESKQLHARTLLTDLTRDDFRVFDNGKEMPINSFDSGANQETRPLSLWLIVPCNHGFPPEWASGFLRGKTQYFRPAFAQLELKDVVGVAPRNYRPPAQRKRRHRPKPIWRTSDAEDDRDYPR
jgi:hypothetical protein